MMPFHVGKHTEGSHVSQIVAVRLHLLTQGRFLSRPSFWSMLQGEGHAWSADCFTCRQGQMLKPSPTCTGVVAVLAHDLHACYPGRQAVILKHSQTAVPSCTWLCALDTPPAGRQSPATGTSRHVDWCMTGACAPAAPAQDWWWNPQAVA